MSQVNSSAYSPTNGAPQSGGGCAVILIIVGVGISIVALGVGLILSFFTLDPPESAAMAEEPIISDYSVSVPATTPTLVATPTPAGTTSPETAGYEEYLALTRDLTEMLRESLDR